MTFTSQGWPHPPLGGNVPTLDEVEGEGGVAREGWGLPGEGDGGGCEGLHERPGGRTRRGWGERKEGKLLNCHIDRQRRSLPMNKLSRLTERR